MSRLSTPVVCTLAVVLGLVLCTPFYIFWPKPFTPPSPAVEPQNGKSQAVGVSVPQAAGVSARQAASKATSQPPSASDGELNPIRPQGDGLNSR